MNIPNLLSISRILAVPVFIVLMLEPTPLRALAAGIVFSLASATDWLDGYLARRLGQAGHRPAPVARLDVERQPEAVEPRRPAAGEVGDRVAVPLGPLGERAAVERGAVDEPDEVGGGRGLVSLSEDGERHAPTEITGRPAARRAGSIRW